MWLNVTFFNRLVSLNAFYIFSIINIQHTKLYIIRIVSNLYFYLTTGCGTVPKIIVQLFTNNIVVTFD